ncbi:MAG: hypothetical protein ACR2J4_10275, partial [Deinococcus sp.]
RQTELLFAFLEEGFLVPAPSCTLGIFSLGMSEGARGMLGSTYGTLLTLDPQHYRLGFPGLKIVVP